MADALLKDQAAFGVLLQSPRCTADMAAVNGERSQTAVDRSIRDLDLTICYGFEPGTEFSSP